jgi:thiamine biosynthesis lipoprotein
VSSSRAAYVEQVMGMPISVHVRGADAEGAPARAAVAAVFAELRAVDARFSTYRSDSEIARIGAGTLAPAEAAAEVREVVALCDEAYRRTGGAFDAWLRGDDGRPRFDPTGLVKGWAVERASRHLAAIADHDFCLNAAGDVIVRCAEDAPAWRVGVEDPVIADMLAAIVELRDGAVATSGTAARGAHIVDPASGEPARALRSVTVAGPSLTWADVYATAAFVRGADAVAFLESVEGYEGLVIDAAGVKRSTAGWP